MNKRERRKIIILSASQVAINFLDLIGVAIFGFVTSLIIQGVNSKAPSGATLVLLQILQIEEMSFQSQTAALSCIAVLIFITRSSINYLITKRIFVFLSTVTSNLSARLLERFFSSDLQSLQSLTPQHTLYILSSGVSTLIITSIGMIISVIADFALLIVLFLGIMIVNPLVAVSSVVIILCTIFALNKLLGDSSRHLGEKLNRESVVASELTLQSLNMYREIVTGNRQGFFVEIMSDQRQKISRIQAEQASLPYLSKTILEISIIVGSLFVSSIQFLFFDSKTAIASLSIFLISFARLSPAAMRIQTSMLQIRSGSALSLETLELVERLESSQPNRQDTTHVSEQDFVPSINIENVVFTFSGNQRPSISVQELYIEPYSRLAIVGPSGAGKSTFVDLMLSIHTSVTGSIKFSNTSVSNAIKKWPGIIGYVPQQVYLLNGTLAQNIRLGLSEELITDTKIFEVINKCGLIDFLEELPGGINEELGEYGRGISGGQRQKIGLARALATNPKILILDEATSALDINSELEINRTLENLRGEMTQVIIAHRLETVRSSDKVIYVEGGQIKASGTFKEVREKINNFDSQAKLIGQ